MNILFVDAVGPFGGASRSLYELCQYIKEKNIELYFLGTRGTSIDFYKKLTDNIIVAQGLFRFDNTRYSYYKGMRWILIFAELLKLPFTFIAIFKVCWFWRKKIDLIHCNEITDVLTAIILKILLRVPLVTHVRSVQAGCAAKRRTEMINILLKRFVDRVIYIDETVKCSCPSVPGDVIHNSINLNIAETDIDALIGARGLYSEFNVVYLGNLQSAKGFRDLLEAFRIIKTRGFEGIKLHVYGTNTHNRSKLTHAILSFLGLSADASNSPDLLVERLGIRSCVSLHGFESDLLNVFSDAHVLIFASHFNAPGRPIFEAAYFAVPSIAAIDNPTADTFVADVTGLTVQPHDPVGLSSAIISLYKDRVQLGRLGANARSLALANHLVGSNGLKYLGICNDLVDVSAKGS